MSVSNLKQDPISSDMSPTIRTTSDSMGVDSKMSVRRLTPTECERLQGYPDDWTRWKCDDTEIADKPRYRMIGNGVAAPVAQWVGERLLAASS